MILLVLYGYFILDSNLKPYKEPFINRVSYYAEFAQLCTFAFVMIYLRKNDNEFINNLVFCLLLLMNGIFWSQLGYFLGRFYYNMAKEKIAMLKAKLFKKKEDDDGDEAGPQADMDSIGSEDDIKRRKKKRRRRAQAVKVYKGTGSKREARYRESVTS